MTGFMMFRHILLLFLLALGLAACSLVPPSPSVGQPVPVTDASPLPAEDPAPFVPALPEWDTDALESGVSQVALSWADSVTDHTLWPRLRRGFALNLDVESQRVESQVKWYARHPDYLNRVFTRGSRYLYAILNEAEKRGIPTELALLPVVESAFDPFAYS
ncbi:MAG: hypothetical protein D6758_07450, partial [Gammaproteobacteria bacterium]